MVFQVISGFLLTFLFTNSTQEAYSSIILGEVNLSGGWLIHLFHSKLASLLFLFLYLHIFKHLTYGRQRLRQAWTLGGMILFLSMAVAFLGYSLTYRDMRYWAATVISNLLGVVPFVGDSLVVWFRADFFVRDGTLKFFFALHFILPFLILVLVAAHVDALHQGGRSPKRGKNFFVRIVSFQPFLVKDIINFIFLLFFSFFVLLFPFFITDARAFVTANTIKRPRHIQPEWYFLITYALLRSSSHKSLAVLYLVFVLVFWLFFFPPVSSGRTKKGKLVYFFGVCYFFFALHLSYLGSCTIDAGYVLATSLASCGLGFLSLVITFLLWV